MTKKELLLVVWCLEKLSGEFGSCGCNDFSFPKDWTLAEKAEFARQYNILSRTPEDHDQNKPWLPDFGVADLLAHKVRQMAESVAN